MTLLPTDAMAWRGGPFSNNSPLPTGYAGTYRASITGVNIIGIAAFSSSNVGLAGGRFIIFNRGLIYVGECDTIINGIDGTITGILSGGLNVPGTGTAAASIALNILALQGSTFLNGFFEANIDSTAANFSFSGKGKINLFRAGGSVEQVGDSDTLAISSTREIVRDSTITIRVFGIRTSLAVLQSRTQASPVSAFTGGGPEAFGNQP
ncbi:MAG: hypothetical protein ACFCU3_10565 [Verrucomicrobiales bacterium]